MRAINYIVVHCTATQPTATVEAIKKYWRDVMKWKTVGYHYIIKADGEVVNLLDVALYLSSLQYRSKPTACM